MNSTLAESRGLHESFAKQNLADLIDLGDLLARSLPVGDVFRAISVRVCSLLNCDAARLFLLTKDRKSLYWAGSWTTEAATANEGNPVSIPGSTVRCLSSKQVVIGAPETVGDPGWTVAIPLLRGSEAIGVMELVFPGTPASIDEIRSDLTKISEIASRVIVNAMIFERNRSAALVDMITEQPNRRAFDLALEHRIAEVHSKPSGGSLSILVIDIEDFAGVNHTLGFGGGDELLGRIANILQRNLREMDLLARSHGDEFLVLLPEAQDETLSIISRIQDSIGREQWVYNGAPIRIKLNFGWAVFGKDGQTASSLLASARIRKNSLKVSPRDLKVLLFRQT